MLAQRFAALEVGLQRLQQCRFIGSVTLGLLLLLLRNAVQPQLHQRKVGDRELEVHHLDVAQRIDRTARVKHCRVCRTRARHGKTHPYP